MTLYLTDNTAPEEIVRARQSGFIHAVKYYPAGATTNSDSGVTDLSKAYPAIAAMEEAGLPLLLHGEVTDPESTCSTAKRVFIERHLTQLMRDFPGAEDRPSSTSPPGKPPSSVPPRAPTSRRPSPRTICCTTATRCSRAASARITTACRCSSAKRIARRWWPRRPPATRNFSSAPTARRIRPPEGARLRLRRLLHRACGDRALCRSLRGGRCAGQAGSLRQLSRRRLLRPAA